MPDPAYLSRFMACRMRWCDSRYQSSFDSCETASHASFCFSTAPSKVRSQATSAGSPASGWLRLLMPSFRSTSVPAKVSVHAEFVPTLAQSYKALQPEHGNYPEGTVSQRLLCPLRLCESQKQCWILGSSSFSLPFYRGVQATQALPAAGQPCFQGFGADQLERSEALRKPHQPLDEQGIQPPGRGRGGC